MTDARRPLPTDRLRALVASGRLWLVELLAWFAGVLRIEPCVRRALMRELDYLHRAVALLVFADAQRGFVMPCRPLRTRRPPSAPVGFARARENGPMRLLWRSVPRGVGLRARIQALRSAMEDVPRLAARFLCRLYKKPFACAIVPVRAPRTRALLSPSAPVAAADTS